MSASMPSHDRSDRTPASYRTTRPATYRTTNPAREAGAATGPSVHRTAGRYGALPRVVAPRPATPGPQSRPTTSAPQDIEDGAADADRWSAEARRPVRAYYVDSDCLIGVRHPHRPGLLQARSVDAGGHPRVMLPVLRRFWSAAGSDSTRLAAQLLAHDWRCLDPAIATTAPTSQTAADAGAGITASTPGDHHGSRGRPGLTDRRVIAGVGITTSTGPGAAIDGEPALVVPLAHLGLLDAAWLYLLDPAGDSVAVHTGDGGLVSRHLLAA